ncbi:MAG: DNA repair protein RadC [Coriobacteriia bacterium]|nr:DNA repair protein RadC [Coriobacteriia bacterium]
MEKEIVIEKIACGLLLDVPTRDLFEYLCGDDLFVEIGNVISRDGTSSFDSVSERYACREIADYEGALVEIAVRRGEDGSKQEALLKARAAEVLAEIELGKRIYGTFNFQEEMNTPEAVASYCYPLMKNFDREHFWMLALNAKNRLVHRSEVSVGTVDATIVGVREVFKDALAASAVGVIVVHNHPSGDPHPSKSDIRVSRRLKEAGDLLGIALLDHVIVGVEGRNYSLRRYGDLDG